MPCALEKIKTAEVSGHTNVINVSHDVNSILYAVTNSYPKAGKTEMLSMFFVVKTQPYSR